MSLLLWLLDKILPDHGIKFATEDDDPEAKRLRAALVAGDYTSVAEFFWGLQRHDEREFYMRDLMIWDEHLPVFGAWPTAMPKCSEAFVCRGMIYEQWGWEARGSGTADKVQDEAWPVFRERLERAWNDYERAAALNPRDATVFAEMIDCAKGLQMEKPEVMNLLKRARAIAPDAWEPHYRMVAYLAEKWHGSHEEMFDYVRRVTAAAPEGSGLPAIVCAAHLEYWSFVLGFERNAVDAAAHWIQPAVKQEVLQAYYKSVGSPKYVPTRASRWHRNFFAFILTRVQAYKEAYAVFKQIGDRPWGYPWHLGSEKEPLDNFLKYRYLAQTKS